MKYTVGEEYTVWYQESYPATKVEIKRRAEFGVKCLCIGEYKHYYLFTPLHKKYKFCINKPHKTPKHLEVFRTMRYAPQPRLGRQNRTRSKNKEGELCQKYHQ